MKSLRNIDRKKESKKVVHGNTYDPCSGEYYYGFNSSIIALSHVVSSAQLPGVTLFAAALMSWNILVLQSGTCAGDLSGAAATHLYDAVLFVLYCLFIW